MTQVTKDVQVETSVGPLTVRLGYIEAEDIYGVEIPGIAIDQDGDVIAESLAAAIRALKLERFRAAAGKCGEQAIPGVLDVCPCQLPEGHEGDHQCRHMLDLRTDAT